MIQCTADVWPVSVREPGIHQHAAIRGHRHTHSMCVCFLCGGVVSIPLPRLWPAGCIYLQKKHSSFVPQRLVRKYEA